MEQKHRKSERLPESEGLFMKRWGDLKSEILADSNLDAAFEEVVGH